MASKNVIADLNKGEKLDDKNYYLWSKKIQYLLNELDVLETLTTTMEPPEEGTTVQHRRDKQTYDEWVKKDRCSRFTMLSSMHNDLIGEFESCKTAKEMWDMLKKSYGGTTATRLRELNYKLDRYKKEPKHTMVEHLRVMSSMIRELSAVGTTLTEEQQIQVVLRSLPDTWEPFTMTMIHNDSIKTLANLKRHLELEYERRGAKDGSFVFMAQAGPRNAKGKHKRQAKGNDQVKANAPNKKGNAKHRRGKRGGKTKMTCYNCQKVGHFVRECTEKKKCTI